MSHSDDFKQKYLGLYNLRQSAIASSLHSNLAQPIIAAKNFASAITNIKGDDDNLKEARELAQVILEMTDQAYIVTYDLMRENEYGLDIDSNESMQSKVMSYAKLLRLNSRGIELKFIDNLSPSKIDRFLQTVVLDWVKSLLIYLARHTKVSIVTIKMIANDSGVLIEVASNIELSSKELNAELLISNTRKQIHVFDGTLEIDDATNETCIKLFMPPMDKTMNTIK